MRARLRRRRPRNSCVTTEPIPPGECIEVTGCDLDNNGGVLINPHGAGLDPVEECSCLDNWSLVHPNTDCGDPTCGSADGFYDELVDDDCELTLPDEDYGDAAHLVLVHVYDDGVAATTDTPVEFEYVSSLASCTTTDHHYRFDNAASPTKIVLCPKTCQRVQAAAFVSSDVWVELSCASAPTYSQTSFVEAYEGACGYQRGVQWADLAFSATIPSDSQIIWKVAAAADPADLPDDAADSGWITARHLDQRGRRLRGRLGLRARSLRGARRATDGPTRAHRDLDHARPELGRDHGTDGRRLAGDVLLPLQPVTTEDDDAHDSSGVVAFLRLRRGLRACLLRRRSATQHPR